MCVHGVLNATNFFYFFYLHIFIQYLFDIKFLSETVFPLKSLECPFGVTKGIFPAVGKQCRDIKGIFHKEDILARF